MMEPLKTMTGRDAALQAFDRLFEKAAAKLAVECSDEERRQARLDFAERSDAALEMLSRIKLSEFPEEAMRGLEDSIDRLSTPQLVGYLASIPLAVQIQEIIHQIAYRTAEQGLLSHLITQADETYGGN